MSSFSSWGIPGSLKLKPEITAPGGNIYSVDGQTPGGQSYENMSGTSMAAPQVAGMVALAAEYIRENNLAEQTGLTPRQLAPKPADVHRRTAPGGSRRRKLLVHPEAGSRSGQHWGRHFLQHLH